MYTVYMHITPSGKKYIGLTSMAVEERWASGQGELNHFYGKHHTEESLQKMRGPRKPLGKQSPEHVRKRVEARRKTLELKKKLAEEQADKAMSGAD